MTHNGKFSSFGGVPVDLGVALFRAIVGGVVKLSAGPFGVIEGDF